MYEGHFGGDVAGALLVRLARDKTRQGVMALQGDVRRWRVKQPRLDASDYRGRARAPLSLASGQIRRLERTHISSLSMRVCQHSPLTGGS